MSMRHLLPIGVLTAACSTSEGSAGPLTLEARGWFGPGPGDLSACPAAYEQVDGGDCSRSERAIGQGDEDALGFDAAALLALVSGEHRSELTWNGGASGAGGRTELVLTVEPRGDARFVERDFRYPRDGYGGTISNNGARYLECGDRLAVDAQLTIVSADGALNEVVDAVVEADSDRYAKITITSSREQLAGSVLASPRDTNGQPFDELTLTFGISVVGLEASLAAHPRFVRDDLDTQRCSVLGSMFLSSSCSPWGAAQLAPGDDLLGLSFEGAIALANTASPAILLDTGAELRMTFEASPEPTCIGIDTPASLPSILEFPGRVQLASSDGRVGGSMDVLLTAEASGGQLRRVTATAEYLSPESSELSELAPSYAILEPLVWSELENGGFEFFAQSGEDGARGILRAYGAEISCPGTRPCEDVCPGPGCTATQAEKWAVRWGDPSIGAGSAPPD
jgi:hypothetical protein